MTETHPITSSLHEVLIPIHKITILIFFVCLFVFFFGGSFFFLFSFESNGKHTRPKARGTCKVPDIARVMWERKRSACDSGRGSMSVDREHSLTIYASIWHVHFANSEPQNTQWNPYLVVSDTGLLVQVLSFNHSIASVCSVQVSLPSYLAHWSAVDKHMEQVGGQE